MFMGEYSHTVDNKGRLIFPAKFREGLGEKFIATKGLDNCLFVYPQEEWAILENKLKQLPMAKPEARAFVRFFFAGAADWKPINKAGCYCPTTCGNMPSSTKMLSSSAFPAGLKYGVKRPGKNITARLIQRLRA